MQQKVLDHVRVLDLTAWQAGPTVTMILADFGAEVLKIEAPRRLDGWRGGSGLLKDRAYERSPIWNAVNRNKLGLSLDLKTEQGRAVFLRLVEDADVVVENFTPRVMGSFGLGYDVLRAANEKVILIALSGFGASGPWRDYSAFAFPTEEVSGITYLTGDHDGSPVLVGQPVTDALAGVMGAFAVVAALHKRETTGKGEYIDLSQVETLTNVIAAEILDVSLNGRDAERKGNLRTGLEPQGVFPCQPAGTWVAVAVRSDAEWRSLCRVIDRNDLLADPALATVHGRAAARSRIHDAVTRWTCSHDGFRAVEALQREGVPASVAMRPSHLMNDEQLWARGFFRMLEREEVGAQTYPGPVVRLTRTPASFDRPAPLFGQHTREILHARLGLTDAELDELEAAGVTATQPTEQDWR
jgi:crotonobetainyl-CoA:carnitine CoA-transferase CaiB-like acyl-CoA transferase